MKEEMNDRWEKEWGIKRRKEWQLKEGIIDDRRRKNNVLTKYEYLPRTCWKRNERWKKEWHENERTRNAGMIKGKDVVGRNETYLVRKDWKGRNENCDYTYRLTYLSPAIKINK